jgi:hypothetical protein
VGHSGVQRDPAAFVKNLQIDMGEKVPPEWVGSGEHQPHGMPDRLQHRAQQDGHVVAVARAQFQHTLRRVQDLHPERVLGVADVLLDPLEQRLGLPQVIFGLDPPLEQYIDGRLAYMEILRTLLYEVDDMLDGLQRTRIAARDLLQMDFGWRIHAYQVSA